VSRQGLFLFIGEIILGFGGTWLALAKVTGRMGPPGSFTKEITMIRTIAAAIAAFFLVSFGAFAQGSAGSSTDTGTSAKTETKSDTAGTKSKKHKKAKKAKKDTAAKDSSTASPK
jgi:hypothetical protein